MKLLVPASIVAAVAAVAAVAPPVAHADGLQGSAALAAPTYSSRGFADRYFPGTDFLYSVTDLATRQTVQSSTTVGGFFGDFADTYTAPGITIEQYEAQSTSVTVSAPGHAFDSVVRAYMQKIVLGPNASVTVGGTVALSVSADADACGCTFVTSSFALVLGDQTIDDVLTVSSADPIRQRTFSAPISVTYRNRTSRFVDIPFSTVVEVTGVFASPVPEAATAGLMFGGLGVLGLLARRRRSRGIRERERAAP